MMLTFVSFLILIAFGIMCVLIGHSFAESEGHITLVIGAICLFGLISLIFYNNNSMMYEDIVECIDNGANVNWCVEKYLPSTHTKDSPFLKHIGYKESK